MPLYSFKCEECGHVWDDFKRVAEVDDLQPCEQCGKTAGKNFIASEGGFQLKGSGWYATDHKRKRTRNI